VLFHRPRVGFQTHLESVRDEQEFPSLSVCSQYHPEFGNAPCPLRIRIAVVSLESNISMFEPSTR